MPDHDGLRPHTDSRRACPVLDTGGTRTGHSLQEHTTQKETDMVNRNGSNNGHSNGTGNGLVHVNGNGHDAALDATHHELLWGRAAARRHQRPGAAPRPRPGLAAQGPRRAHLRLPGRPRRHRPGQPHLRLWRMGIRASGRRDPAPDRERRHQDGGGEDHLLLQRPGAGHRPRCAAPHRHRVQRRGRGQRRRSRDRHQGRGDGRHEAGAQELRGSVRQRLLRRPAGGGSRRPPGRPPGRRAGTAAALPGPSALPPRQRRRPARRTRQRCASGSSRSPPSRASARTGCGAPSQTGRARASTTWTPRSWPRWWRPPPRNSRRRGRRRQPSPSCPSDTQSSGVVSSRAAPLLIYRKRRTRPMTTMHTPWGPPRTSRSWPRASCGCPPPATAG